MAGAHRSTYENDPTVDNPHGFPGVYPGDTLTLGGSGLEPGKSFTPVFFNHLASGKHQGLSHACATGPSGQPRPTLLRPGYAWTSSSSGNVSSATITIPSTAEATGARGPAALCWMSTTSGGLDHAYGSKPALITVVQPPSGLIWFTDPESGAQVTTQIPL